MLAKHSVSIIKTFKNQQLKIIRQLPQKENKTNKQSFWGKEVWMCVWYWVRMMATWGSFWKFAEKCFVGSEYLRWVDSFKNQHLQSTSERKSESVVNKPSLSDETGVSREVECQCVDPALLFRRLWKHMNRHAQQTILEVLGTSNSPLSVLGNTS